MTAKDNAVFEFGDFRLDAGVPSLWRGGELVGAPPKAVETLVQLVAARGEIVSRETLLDTVWKDTFVEEGNINYTISLLRKTLGDKEAIQTVPRRGYRFTHQVREVADSESAVPVGGTVPETSRRWIFISLFTVCVLLLTSFMWIAKWPIVPASERTIRSLAVLPLKNLNADEPDDTFSLGVADLLISRLGSLDRFAVRPIDTVAPFAKSGDDANAFAAKLKVDAVFTGTFRRENDRLLVNARLLDLRDGAQIWSGQFDVAETNVFDLEENLTREIALSISTRLTDTEQRRLAKRGTESTDAYRAYVRGRAILDQRIPNKFERAAAEFARAIALDPTYSLAYSGMADALSRQANQAPAPQSSQIYTKARSYATRAMELDPESSEAFVAIGRVKRLADWDWAGAEQDFQRAIALNPNNADARIFYGQMLGFLGKFDAGLAEIEQAIVINPISAVAIASRLAVLEGKRDIDEALRLAEENLKMSRESTSGLRPVATFSLHKNELARTIELAEEGLAKNLEPRWAWHSLLAAAYSRSLQPDKAADQIVHLEQLAVTDTKALYSLAVNYGELGRTDEAIAALEKCFAQHEERMVWLNVEPRFAPLRSDPRFADLVRRMNL